MKILSYLLILFSINSFGATTYPNIPVHEVTKVYDGDTFTINILGYPSIIGEAISVRVKGYNSPEIRGKCEKEKQLAVEAREYLKKLLMDAKSIELREVERGKYFRIAASVYVDGENISNKIIEKQFGREYFGGKRLSWCD